MSALRLTFALSLLASCSEVEVDCRSLSKEGCWDQTEECRRSGPAWGCLELCSGQSDCEEGFVCTSTGYATELDGPEEANAFADLCRDDAWMEESSSQ